MKFKIYFVLAFICAMFITSGVSAEMISMENAVQDMKDVVEIRAPVFNGTGLEAMATAAGGSLSIDYTDFAGFYYELDDGVGSEAMKISNGSANVSNERTIEENGLVYTTDIQKVSYEFDDWNAATVFTDTGETTYEKLGFLAEEYVPIKSKPEKLSKLIMDSDDEFTLGTGQSLDLGDGYTITVQQVDVEGDKVWLELTKDGEFVDDKVVTVSGTQGVDAKTRTWEYDIDIAGETDVVLMRVHVKEVFQGILDSLAVIEGIWLISDDIKTIESDDTFGKLEVTDTGMGAAGPGLTLKNENSITLTKDTVIDLSDGMKIKVADSDDVRFYFMKEITESGTYEVRGTVVNASIIDNFVWDERSFAGFYYDIDDNVASESLNITTSGTTDRTIAEGDLIYTTTIQQVSYEYDPWSGYGETYRKIGLFAEEYVPIKEDKAEKLSKLIIDSDEIFTLRTGQSLDIGDGYTITVQQVDVEGDKVWLELTKDGEFVEDEVVDVTAALDNSSWNYEADVGGETDVLLMRVHVQEVFQGPVDSLAVIKGIWLISDDIMEIESDDEFGKLDKVTLGGNYLEMTNDNSITLTSDSIIDLAEDMKLRVADSEDGDVRYYPFVEFEFEALSIEYFSPVALDFTSYVGVDQEFRINTHKICNFTWFISGKEIQNDHSAFFASYVNNTANVGFYNVTVVAETLDEVVQHTWNWTVISSDDDIVPIKKDSVEIRSPVFNGTDLEAMATAAGGSLSTDYTDFAGFYYELDDGVGSEVMKISNGSANVSNERTIEENGLVYTTDVQKVSYEFEDWNDATVFTDTGETTYEKLGFLAEKYVPIKSKPDKLSRLIMDSDEKFTLRTGQSLDLGDGYTITAQQIDVEGDKVWLDLTKDGEFVDDEVVTVSGTSTVYAKNRTWEYDTDIAGETDVVLMRVHVKNVFQGILDSLVVIEGIWLISDDIKTIQSDDRFGKFEVTDLGMGAAGLGLTLKNENSITLTRNTVIDLSDGMKIKVADSDDVRFYFMKDITEPGICELRGSIAEDEVCTWTPMNFQGFYYDIDNDIGTESLEILNLDDRIISKNNLTYSTTVQEMNFEYNVWGNFDVIGFFGEMFFTGHRENIFDDVNLLSDGLMSKVLINEDKSRALYSGLALVLDEGYVLNIIEVDKNGNKVFVTLSKEGSEVDSSVISAGDTYAYAATLGSYDNVPIIAVYFDEVFEGTETDAVFVEGIFQISDNCTSLNVGDGYGAMNITSRTPTGITMKNNESFDLLENSIIPIMGNIQFKVADDIDHVRFYPFVEVEIGPLSIDNCSPVDSDLTSDVGIDQEFKVNTNKICNFTWFINGIETQINHSALFASYANNNANAGFYNVTIVAETSNEVVQHTWNWTVTSSDGGNKNNGGGSGGGGGGSSGEDYYNILKKEVKREYVNANSEISYEFKEETNAIDDIKFTSLKNSGTIAATVEVLKDTSSLVETKPSGEVYQNMNIWVGTVGFATPQNIADPVIGFKVERSWIEENDIVMSSIRLCRYHNDVWDYLTTREIGDDEKYIYFGADTSGFSPFAIIGYTEEEMTAQYVDEPTLGLEDTRMSPPSDIASEADMGDEVPATETDTIPGLGISALMLLIGCAYLTMRGVKHP